MDRRKKEERMRNRRWVTLFFQGAAKGVRQKEFDHSFPFWSLFGRFFDTAVTFFITFFARLLLPDSFGGRVILNICGNFLPRTVISKQSP